MKTEQTAFAENFGLALYFSTSGAELSGLLSELLDSASNIAGISFSVVETSAPDSDRFSKRKVSKLSREGITNELAKSKLASVTMYDKDISPHIRCPRADVSILNLQLNTSENLHRLDFSIPRGKLKLKELVSWSEGFVRRNETLYGFMCKGSFNYVQSLLSLVGIIDFNAWMKMDENDEDPLGNEVGFYAKNLHLLPSRIPRAFWGNLLSGKHVFELGGEAKLRKDLPELEINKWGGCYFIRFRNDPWLVNDKSILNLNDYFAPIRFPDAPPPQLR